MTDRDSETELNVQEFRKQLPNLLPANNGRYAVGRVGDAFECRSTYDDAQALGYKKYGPKSFVVMPVLFIEVPAVINSVKAIEPNPKIIQMLKELAELERLHGAEILNSPLRQYHDIHREKDTFQLARSPKESPLVGMSA